eukprot:115471_1
MYCSIQLANAQKCCNQPIRSVSERYYVNNWNINMGKRGNPNQYNLSPNRECYTNSTQTKTPTCVAIQTNCKISSMEIQRTDLSVLKKANTLKKYNTKNLKSKKMDIEKLHHKKKSNVKRHEKKMLKYGVYQNRYYHNIEGKQAVKYRKNWNNITKHIAKSTYRIKMKPTIKHLNNFFKICNKSKPNISQKKIRKADEEIILFYENWNKVKQ